MVRPLHAPALRYRPSSDGFPWLAAEEGVVMKCLANITAAVGLLLLAACETTGGAETGTGLLHLSRSTASLFEQYKGEFIPYIFMVTTDGRWGNYVYCDNACTRHSARASAFTYCRDYGKGVPCRVFAIGENIIWKGKVTGLYNPETGKYDLTHGNTGIQNTQPTDEILKSTSINNTTSTISEDIFARAEQGDAEIQYELGKSYYFGLLGVRQDFKKSWRWYRQAAGNGHHDAQYEIGTFYELGVFVSKDLDAALNWYRKSAKQDNFKAQYKIGLFYEQGKGVPIDLVEARRWYQRAAALGHTTSRMAFSRLNKVTPSNDQATEVEDDPGATDISESLRKVKQLLDEGLITEAEAAEKRKDILDEF